LRGEIQTHTSLSACMWRRRRGNTSHDVSGPVIGKSASPAPGVSDCERGCDPPWGATGNKPTRPPALGSATPCDGCVPIRLLPLCVVCLGGRRAIWQPAQLISRQYRTLALLQHALVPVCVCDASVFFLHHFFALFISLSRRGTDIWLRERELCWG
jgi:hypothetical protein